MWLAQKYRGTTLRAGFTLLELLTVVMIMALLSMLALTSYFSAIRGMARRSAGEHFSNTLAQARQRACIDGVRVSVIIFNQIRTYTEDGKPDYVPCYVVCRELGRISLVQGNHLFDEFNDLQQLFGSDDEHSAFRLYNLSRGFWTTCRGKVVHRDYGSPATLFATSSVLDPDRYLDPKAYNLETAKLEDYAFEEFSRSVGATDWAVGDAYGVEVAAPINLPKTFYFEGLPFLQAGGSGGGGSDADLKRLLYVTFGPDGRSVDARGNQRSVTFTIKSTDPNFKDRRFNVDGRGVIHDRGN